MWRKPEIIVVNSKIHDIPSMQVACDRISCCW